jgi:hypothetical protein
MKIATLGKALIKDELWISFFVISYVAIIVFWSGAKFIGLSDLREKISPYISMFGIDQSWTLFSPTIRTMNLHNLSIISFADGSLKLYEWPRMDKTDGLGRVTKEKYRKMLDDCLPWAEYRMLAPAQGSFVARANVNPANPPQRLLLSYFWTDIPSPKGWINRLVLPEHSRLKNYFLYQVQPEDLLLKRK